MKILKVHINRFGKHHNLDLRMQDGFNLLSGKNESGKTTIMQFILCVLYGFDKYSRKDVSKNERLRYTPWHGEEFGGYLEFQNAQSTYRLYREFGQTDSKDEISLTNLLSGQEEKIPPNTSPGEYLLGLSRAEFIRSVYVGQLSTVIDKEDQIRNKLMTATSGAASGTSLSEIRQELDQKRKEIDPPRKSGILKNCQEELKIFEEERHDALQIAAEIASTRAELTSADHFIIENQMLIKQITCERERRKIRQEIADIEALQQRKTTISDLDEKIKNYLADLGFSNIKDLPDKSARQKTADNLARWKSNLNLQKHIGDNVRDLQAELEEAEKLDVLQAQLGRFENFRSQHQLLLNNLDSYKEQRAAEEQNFATARAERKDHLQKEKLSWQVRLAEYKDKQAAFAEEIKKLDLDKEDKERADQNAKAGLEADLKNRRSSFDSAGEDCQQAAEELAQEAALTEDQQKREKKFRAQHSEVCRALAEANAEQADLQEKLSSLEVDFDKRKEALDNGRKRELTALKENIASTPHDIHTSGTLFVILGVLLAAAGIFARFVPDLPIWVVAILVVIGFISLIFGLLKNNQKSRRQNNAADYIQRQEKIEKQYTDDSENLITEFAASKNQLDQELFPLKRAIQQYSNQKLALESDIQNVLTNLKEQKNREAASQAKLSDLQFKLEQSRQEYFSAKEKLETYQPFIDEAFAKNYAAHRERLQTESAQLTSDFEQKKKAHEDFIAAEERAIADLQFKESADLTKIRSGLSGDERSLQELAAKLFTEIPFAKTPMQFAVTPQSASNPAAEADSALSWETEGQSDFSYFRERFWQEETQNKIAELNSKISRVKGLSADLEKEKDQLQKTRQALADLRAKPDEWLFNLNETDTLVEAEKLYQQKLELIERVEAAEVSRENQIVEFRQQKEKIAVQDLLQRKKELQERLAQEGTADQEFADCSDEAIDQRMDEIAAEQNDLIRKKGILEQRMEQLLASSRVLQQIEEDIEDKQMEIRAIEQELADLDLAISMVDQMNDELQKSLGPVINEKTTRILADLTGETEQAVYVDKEFKVRLEDPRTGRTFESEYFSNGKIDQIYLAVRLAIALTLYDDAGGEHLPLFIDDSLVQYDSDRSKSALRYLNQMADAEKRQIIFTTCHQAYETYLGRGANIIRMSDLT